MYVCLPLSLYISLSLYIYIIADNPEVIGDFCKESMAAMSDGCSGEARAAICISIYLSIYLPIYLSIYLSISPPPYPLGPADLDAEPPCLRGIML